MSIEKIIKLKLSTENGGIKIVVISEYIENILKKISKDRISIENSQNSIYIGLKAYECPNNLKKTSFGFFNWGEGLYCKKGINLSFLRVVGLSKGVTLLFPYNATFKETRNSQKKLKTVEEDLKKALVCFFKIIKNEEFSSNFVIDIEKIINEDNN